MSLNERDTMDMPSAGEAGKEDGREAWRGRSPTTSTTLLRAIRDDAASKRWAEFVERYRPMMEAFLAKKRVNADEREEIILETLTALVKQLPKYRYCRGEGKAFHNYLTGILDHKRMDAWNAKKQREKLDQQFGEWLVSLGKVRPALDYDTGGEDGKGADRVFATGGEGPGVSREEWERSIFHIALQQLLADEDVSPRNREIFRRTSLDHEPVEAVAEALMMKRNTVDKVNSRMRERLKKIVEGLEALEGPLNS